MSRYKTNTTNEEPTTPTNEDVIWNVFSEALSENDGLAENTLNQLNANQEFKSLLVARFNFTDSVVSHVKALIDEYIRKEYLVYSPNGKLSVIRG